MEHLLRRRGIGNEFGGVSENHICRRFKLFQGLRNTYPKLNVACGNAMMPGRAAQVGKGNASELRFDKSILVHSGTEWRRWAKFSIAGSTI